MAKKIITTEEAIDLWEHDFDSDLPVLEIIIEYAELNNYIVKD